MPTYEYFCTKCEKGFDIVQSMTDKALAICPKELCRMKQWGKGKVKKQIGAGAGIIFKGSGFYITDYRSDSYKEAAKKESPPKTADAGDKSATKKEVAKAASPPQTKTPEKGSAKE